MGAKRVNTRQSMDYTSPQKQGLSTNRLVSSTKTRLSTTHQLPKLPPPHTTNYKTTTRTPCNRNSTTYLNKNPVRLRNSLEQIISGPTNCNKTISQFIWRHQSSKFDHTPSQHCSCKCHREPKFDIVTSIIVPTSQVSIICPPIT